MKKRLHSAADVLAVLRSAQERGKYHCPLCGGHNLTVRAGRGGTPLVQCWNCTPDGDARRAWFGKFMAALFPNAGEHGPPAAKFPPHREAPAEARSTSSDDKKREGRIRAARLWAAARTADEEIRAHTYLVGRTAWPPAEPPLPGAVRWIDRKNWPKGVWPTPPKCAGAILYGYTVVGTESRKPLAVNAEALDAHGKRLRSERWRKCIGSRQGLAFALPGRGFAGPIIVCEGEVDALACFWMRPGAHLIMASGGSGALAALAPGLVKMTRRAGGPTVEIEPDGDSAGFKGVAELIRALALESVRAHAHPLRIGGDPAADLRARIKARLARTNLADAWARELNLAE